MLTAPTLTTEADRLEAVADRMTRRLATLDHEGATRVRLRADERRQVARELRQAVGRVHGAVPFDRAPWTTGQLPPDVHGGPTVVTPGARTVPAGRGGCGGRWARFLARLGVR